MAINQSEEPMFVSVAFYPAAAGLGAFLAGADSFLAALFLAAGLAVGVVATYLGNKVAHSIWEFVSSHAARVSQGWAKKIVRAGMIVLHKLLPHALLWSGVIATLLGSRWVARHIL